MCLHVVTWAGGPSRHEPDDGQGSGGHGEHDCPEADQRERDGEDRSRGAALGQLGDREASGDETESGPAPSEEDALVGKRETRIRIGTSIDVVCDWIRMFGQRSMTASVMAWIPASRLARSSVR